MRASSPNALLRAQFLRFAAVGAAGFVVDESVLALVHNLTGLNASLSRVISIACAMTFTWWGNRTLTFHEHAAHGLRAMAGEWLRFVGANSIGALFNFATYLALIQFAPGPLANPYLATAVGVGVGLVFNFVSSRTMVFTTKRPSAAGDA